MLQRTVLFFLVIGLAVMVPAIAQDAISTDDTADGQGGSGSGSLSADSSKDHTPEVITVEVPPADDVSMGKALATVGATLGAALCAIGGGFAIARIGGNCIESIARQPEAAGSMFAPMIITAAMVEGGMLFAVVVCLLGIVMV